MCRVVRVRVRVRLLVMLASRYCFDTTDLAAAHYTYHPLTHPTRSTHLRIGGGQILIHL